MPPRLFAAHQSLPAPVEPDVPGAARHAARTLAAGLKPSASVAVTGGSRGIACIAEITGAVVAELDRLGLRPFTVPAMGSQAAASPSSRTSGVRLRTSRLWRRRRSPHGTGNCTGPPVHTCLTCRSSRQTCSSCRPRNAIDWGPTSINCLTSGWLGGLKLPYALPSDHAAIETAVGLYDPATVRVAVIHDTLHLTRIWLSESLLEEAPALPTLSLRDELMALPFTRDGALALD